MNTTPSPNFAYLAHHDPRLAALGTQAEQQFAIDPSVTLTKLRLFAEVLAKRAAAKVGLYQAGEKQQELVDRLYARKLRIPSPLTLTPPKLVATNNRYWTSNVQGRTSAKPGAG